jgi:hypothetical protein
LDEYEAQYADIYLCLHSFERDHKLADPLGQGQYAAGKTSVRIEHVDSDGGNDRDNTWEIQHPFFIVWVLLTKTAYVNECAAALVKPPNCTDRLCFAMISRKKRKQ